MELSAVKRDGLAYKRCPTAPLIVPAPNYIPLTGGDRLSHNALLDTLGDKGSILCSLQIRDVKAAFVGNI